MANFLTVRKFNAKGQVYSVDSAEYFYNNRKFNFPNGIYFSDSAEYFYNNRKFNALQLGVTFTINGAPVVDNPIPDQEVTEGNLFSFIVPANTFSDPEADTLTLSATLDDDSPLPSWLSFNPITETFSGIPNHSDVGIINIKVTATDTILNSVFDIFQLEVLEDALIKTRDLFKSFRALLPRGRAWNIDLSIQFKQIIDSIMSTAADVKDYFIEIKNDVFPDTTRSLELWEEQFLLDKLGLSESQRRDNLEARWAEQGGQSPTYLEGQLLKLGIVAKVYENFARADPNTFLIGGDSEILVNGDIIFETRKYINTCGNPAVTCGSNATAGEYSGFISETKKYAVSVDTAKWVHYFIIADVASVLTPVDIPASLEKSFKIMVLRIKPTQTRAILNVNYI